MRVLVQRVTSASVEVDNEVVGSIGQGLLAFVGFGRNSQARDIDWMVDKLVGLRIFADDSGHMNHSIQEISGQVLIVSQFTLYGDCRKGRRPSFEPALPPTEASDFYQQFVLKFKERLREAVETGIFGADMKVSLVNDGPVTFWLERESESDV